MKKLQFEKPKSFAGSQIASIQGAFCGHGSNASEGCTTGHDPNLQSVCLPAGASATNNCENGSSALKTCGTGTTPNWGCYNGSGVR